MNIMCMANSKSGLARIALASTILFHLGGGAAFAADVVAGTVAPGAFSGQSMVFVASGGLLQEGQEKAVWNAFSEESGATVLQDTPPDFAKLRAMSEAGSVIWDVFTQSRYLIKEHCGTYFEELDYTKIDISRVPEGFLTDSCSVPVIAYADVLAYNADVYSVAPANWRDFFDLEKFPGNRGINMTNTPSPGVIIAALLGDGVAEEDLYPIDFDRAFAKLRSIEANLVPWTTGAQAQQQLESGEVSMAWVWSGRGFGAAENGANVKPVWNEWILAINSMAIPKGAQNLDLSHAAINYYLGAEQTARVAELTTYVPVNRDAKPELSSLAHEWMFDPNEIDQAHAPDVEWWVENWEELTERWTAWISGY